MEPTHRVDENVGTNFKEDADRSYNDYGHNRGGSVNIAAVVRRLSVFQYGRFRAFISPGNGRLLYLAGANGRRLPAGVDESSVQLPHLVTRTPDEAGDPVARSGTAVPTVGEHSDGLGRIHCDVEPRAARRHVPSPPRHAGGVRIADVAA